MRDYKFRGKRIDNGEWVHGYYAKYGFTNKEKDYIIPSYASALYGFEVDPATVGQYTGIKDIYKGDICDTHTRWGKGEVVFESGMFKVCGISLCTFTPRIEVIGNIHEKED